MATAAVAHPLPNWPSLQQQLEKKATFESAVSTACSVLASQQPGQVVPSSELRSLLARCMKLLKTRHSNPAFWVKARQLFSVAQDRVADETLQAELRDCVRQCSEFLGDEAGPATEQQQEQEQQQQWQQPQQYLFEGILGGSEPAPLAGAAHHPDLNLLAQQLLGDQQAGTSGQQGGQLSEQALEALQQELDAIAVRIMEETGQQAMPATAPPASKKVVRSLPKEALTPARLAELGGSDVRCAVCMEDLHEGDEVQVMPCKHVFHPPCLAPWLEQHNSCPTCRHELPTDDAHYERRKEREKEEAEERRGAENAVSHNEFMYL
ncbi:hypothetical protein N2152v2_004827 [Parachlorella kessleri]